VAGHQHQSRAPRTKQSGKGPRLTHSWSL
jgi:hypothetical protein